MIFSMKNRKITFLAIALMLFFLSVNAQDKMVDNPSALNIDDILAAPDKYDEKLIRVKGWATMRPGDFNLWMDHAQPGKRLVRKCISILSAVDGEEFRRSFDDNFVEITGIFHKDIYHDKEGRDLIRLGTCNKFGISFTAQSAIKAITQKDDISQQQVSSSLAVVENGAKTPIENLSFKDITTSPNSYHKKLIRIKGWISMRHEDHNLWVTWNDHEKWKTKNCISLKYYFTSKEVRQSMDAKLVEVTGIFNMDADHNETGPVIRLGVCNKFSIELTEPSAVKIL